MVFGKFSGHNYQPSCPFKFSHLPKSSLSSLLVGTIELQRENGLALFIGASLPAPVLVELRIFYILPPPSEHLVFEGQVVSEGFYGPFRSPPKFKTAPGVGEQVSCSAIHSRPVAWMAKDLQNQLDAAIGIGYGHRGANEFVVHFTEMAVLQGQFQEFMGQRVVAREGVGAEAGESQPCGPIQQVFGKLCSFLVRHFQLKKSSPDVVLLKVGPGPLDPLLGRHGPQPADPAEK